MRGPRNARRTVAAVGMALALGTTGTLAGCSAAPGASDQATLTIVENSPPTSLNPAINTNGGLVDDYITLAYESLIQRQPDGSYTAGLATKWGYLPGKAGLEYQVTIRSNAEFSDGTAVTPQAVADSINYFIKSGTGPTTSGYAGITATVSGAHSVLLTSKTPNPIMAELLDPANYGGAIISPSGLKDPSKLQNESFGAGPYVYRPSQSVSGDEYVYTPNPRYYDQTRIHFKRIVLKVISDPSSAFEAVRTGQADVMSATTNLLDAAKSSGLDTYAKKTGWNGLFITDTGGKLVPALGDVLVRRAMNYAVNRSAIAIAVYGEHGSGLSQPNTPGADGYAADLEDTYTYNPAKAKSLLAAAGYPNGFNVSLVYPLYQADNAKVMQAIAQQLGEVGITVSLKGDNTVSELVNDLISKKFGLISVNWGAMSEFQLYNQLFAPSASVNTWHYAQPGLATLIDQYSTAPVKSQNAAAQKVQALLVQDALSVPVTQSSLAFVTSAKLKNFGLDPYGTPNNPADWALGN